MRSVLVFLLLFAIKVVGRLFWRPRLEWVREVEDPFSNLRVLALLNHTSLFEPIFAALAPNRLLWQLAAHGVLPVADKTMNRPFVGLFFRFVVHSVIPISRERDHTWATVVERIHDPKALIVILPEGRMKRPTGLDLHGNPMTVRGGIADLIRGVESGKLFLGYSHGLHHIHAPGEPFPRLFRPVTLAAETIDIPEYRERLLAESGEEGFKGAVIADMTRRRDESCGAAHHVPGAAAEGPA